MNLPVEFLDISKYLIYQRKYETRFYFPPGIMIDFLSNRKNLMPKYNTIDFEFPDKGGTVVTLNHTDEWAEELERDSKNRITPFSDSPKLNP